MNKTSCTCGNYKPYREIAEVELCAPIMPMDACFNCWSKQQTIDRLGEIVDGFGVEE